MGLIAMNNDNICDRLTNRLSEEDKDKLRREYDIVSNNFEEMPFLERMVADSRSIGLYHTSGLSTPSRYSMYGPGFDAPEGTVRISLANLDSEDYVEIARRLYELLYEYYEVFEAETALDQAA